MKVQLPEPMPDFRMTRAEYVRHLYTARVLISQLRVWRPIFFNGPDSDRARQIEATCREQNNEIIQRYRKHMRTMREMYHSKHNLAKGNA